MIQVDLTCPVCGEHVPGFYQCEETRPSDISADAPGEDLQWQCPNSCWMELGDWGSLLAEARAKYLVLMKNGAFKDQRG